MDAPRQNPNPNPNPNPKPTKSAKNKTIATKSAFEFCQVCKFNHDQGLRHKYFPNHKKSLSLFLNRVRSKLADVRFFLNSPSPLRPEHASRNRFWCVFCDTAVEELDSCFACGNAINHLASADHLKNLKHFLWKHGGAIDCLDEFIISADDLAKWEKKCKSLKKEEAISSAVASHGHICGPPNDIQNEQIYGIVENFDNNSVCNSLVGVMPLQNHTNEYQISHYGPERVGSIFELPQDSTFSVSGDKYSAASYWSSWNLTGNRCGQFSGIYGDQKMSVLSKVPTCKRVSGTVSENNSFQGLQNLTQISSSFSQGDGYGNVHSGAPPPWLSAYEQGQTDDNGQLSTISRISSSIKLGKSGKSGKLNPKRVGAAWAERRKIELEMERRGEFVRSSDDTEWLPNFGRVWQSGSRKESRKEFEIEKRKLFSIEAQHETPTDVQPYISKRLRRDCHASHDGIN